MPELSPEPSAEKHFSVQVLLSQGLKDLPALLPFLPYGKISPLGEDVIRRDGRVDEGGCLENSCGC